MKPEAQMAVMATLDGYVRATDPVLLASGYWTHPTKDCGCHGVILRPEHYLSDLNAVARVVGKLSEAKKLQYRQELMFELYPSSPIDAPASQRCEAILRAYNLWETT